MAIDDKIRNEKLQYDIDIETPTILALPYGKIDKYASKKFYLRKSTTSPQRKINRTS